MIEINNVSKSFGDFRAAKNVSLTVEDGEYFTLLGPNGAGKTTLIRMLTGLSSPDEGEIRINGIPVSRDNVDVKRMTGVVPQHNNMDKELTVRENLIFFSRLYGLRGDEIGKRTKEILGFTGLEEFAGREFQRLSGGMQRKLMIGKALLHRPSILFLDEPTTGVDPASRRKIWDMLLSMKDSGITVFLTTHYIQEAESLCRRTALMDRGGIIVNEKTGDLKDSLGKITVEYFSEDDGTEFRFFPDRQSAREFAGTLGSDCNIRRLTLEDVFFDLTQRRVN